MLSKDDNELIARVGPGTPMGNLMRQYWIPSMMSAEVPTPDCPPVRLRILGENLIAFRTTSGAVGVVADACPHRGASLFFGRNEEEGLRCVYHGWKFDVLGNCVDMPSEPAESNFKQKVKATAYPTRERGGIIWLYMGPSKEPPPLPEIEANMLPEGDYSVGAYANDCNWLQSLEGDYDTVHSSFLHLGSVKPEQLKPGSMQYYMAKNRWAYFVTEDTGFGCSSGCYRPADEDTTYWRIAHFLFPFFAMIPGGTLGDQKLCMATVPIDDEHCLRFMMGERQNWSAPGPQFDGLTTEWQYDPSHNTTGWLGRFNAPANARNDYLIDRDVQRANVGAMGFTGIPGRATADPSISNVTRAQDGCVTESMGPIAQRSNEHLGVTDSGIIRMRRLLLNAAKELRDHGTIPPGVYQPELYKVRSGSIVLPNGVHGLEGTKHLQWKALGGERPKVQAK